MQKAYETITTPAANPIVNIANMGGFLIDNTINEYMNFALSISTNMNKYVDSFFDSELFKWFDAAATFFFIYQCEEEEKERFLFSLLKSIMFVMN